MRTHLGTRYEVWTGQQSWFWGLSDPARNGGSVGAAATEAAAIREACLAIEEMATHRSVIAKTKSFDPLYVGWERSLNNLEHYLSRLCGANA
jgi:hypothetical protein